MLKCSYNLSTHELLYIIAIIVLKLPCVFNAGSIPVNQLRMYETSHGWQFNEDDERKTSAEFYKTVRGSPEGCDSEPEESNSRRPSKKEPEINNNKNSAV